jgi:hypothetical protein
MFDSKHRVIPADKPDRKLFLHSKKHSLHNVN